MKQVNVLGAAEIATLPRETSTVTFDRRARVVIHSSVLLAMLRAALDQTVVGTALPWIVIYK